MALLSALVASVMFMAGIAVATTATAEPGAVIDDGFLNALNNAGITYRSAPQAVAAGQAVCGLMESGMSGIDVLNEVKNSNPGFTLDSAAKFAAIAAHEYCSHHLKSA
ncbi:MAG: DUF732 domain-containing protein [Mycobacteriaceae bacterium]|nr:DUF732 domain-containing protein [Mycobacteriaceae bacterium]